MVQINHGDLERFQEIGLLTRKNGFLSQETLWGGMPIKRHFFPHPRLSCSADELWHVKVLSVCYICGGDRVACEIKVEVLHRVEQVIARRIYYKRRCMLIWRLSGRRFLPPEKIPIQVRQRLFRGNGQQPIFAINEAVDKDGTVLAIKPINLINSHKLTWRLARRDGRTFRETIGQLRPIIESLPDDYNDPIRRALVGYLIQGGKM